jgi:hypothetical protein
MLSMATRGNFMPPLFRQGSTRFDPAAMDPTSSENPVEIQTVGTTVLFFEWAHA